MRKLASFGGADPLLREIRAFPDMLFIAIQALFTVSQDRKVAADTLASAHVDMREWTVLPGTPSFIEEMQTQWSALWRWVVGEVAGFGVVGAVTLEKVPANGDFSGVVLIHASKAAATSYYKT